MLDLVDELNQGAILAAIIMLVITVFFVLKDPFGTGFKQVPLMMKLILIIGAPIVTYFVTMKKLD